MMINMARRGDAIGKKWIFATDKSVSGTGPTKLASSGSRPQQSGFSKQKMVEKDDSSLLPWIWIELCFLASVNWQNWMHLMGTNHAWHVCFKPYRMAMRPREKPQQLGVVAVVFWHTRPMDFEGLNIIPEFCYKLMTQCDWGKYPKWNRDSNSSKLKSKCWLVVGPPLRKNMISSIKGW